MNPYLDDWTLILQDINYLAVFLCLIAAYVLGFVWYGPKAFGAEWMKLVGLTMKDAEANGMKAMVRNIPITILMALFVAGLYTILELEGVWWGIGLGVDLGIFVSLFVAMGCLYEQRSMRLLLINGGFNVVVLAIMGAIVGLLA